MQHCTLLEERDQLCNDLKSQLADQVTLNQLCGESATVRSITALFDHARHGNAQHLFRFPHAPLVATETFPESG